MATHTPGLRQSLISGEFRCVKHLLKNDIFGQYTVKGAWHELSLSVGYTRPWHFSLHFLLRDGAIQKQPCLHCWPTSKET